MKKLFYTSVVLSVLIVYADKIGAQNANQALSNLNTPTKINTDLLPKNPNTYNLGSLSKSWQDIYIKGKIYFDGLPFIRNTGTENTFIGSNAAKSNTGYDNTANGYQALFSNTTGSINTATGAFSLFKNKTASYNTAYGAFSLYFNTVGEFNTANGRAALYYNSGSYNTAIGDEALYENNNGYANTAIGYTALTHNTTGHNNTANGIKALLNNITGYSNVAIGTNALYKNTAGSNLVAVGDSALYNLNGGGANTAVGSKAMYLNSTGSNNTATGWGALYANGTGNYNSATGVNALHFNHDANYNTANCYYALYYNNGTDNTATGAQALFHNQTGINNTATGVNALLNNITGNSNTAMGALALTNNNGGYFNTAVGYNALNSNYNSSYNTAIGVYAGATIGNATGVGLFNSCFGALADIHDPLDYNATAIGYDAIVTDANMVRIGNFNVSSIGGYANWTNVSDVRVKKNIKQNVPGLAFINKLQPITYNLDLDAADKIIQRPVAKDKDGKQIQPIQQELDARKAKEQIVYTGFAAQDVEKAAKSLNYDFSGVDAAKNSKDLYGLRYSDFVVPLVKAVQELSKMNDDKNASIDSLRNENKDLAERILKLEAMMNVSNLSTDNTQLSTLSSASLEQNVPNPFSNATTIHYTLPQQYSSAKIIITNNSGAVLKIINLNTKGNGFVNINATTLSAGAYQYSLIVDGRTVSSKQMLLAK